MSTIPRDYYLMLQGSVYSVWVVPGDGEKPTALFKGPPNLPRDIFLQQFDDWSDGGEPSGFVDLGIVRPVTPTLP